MGENLKDSSEAITSLQIIADEVEVGKTYPIIGFISEFIDISDDQVVVQISFSNKNPEHKIRAHMTIPHADKIELLKQRAFEPGIFVSTIISKDEGIVVDCSTVLFGKQTASYSA
jgi:hypothetical protein